MLRDFPREEGTKESATEVDPVVDGCDISSTNTRPGMPV